MGKNTGRNLALGAAIAGVAGYVAGILTAPKSGKETRQDVKDAAVRTKQEAEKRLKELHSKIESLIDEGKKKTAKLNVSAQQDWDKVVANALVAKEKVREVLSALHDGDADDKDLKNAMKEAAAAVDHLKAYLTKNAKS